MSGITVCIASIPPRAVLRQRAVESVLKQTLQPETIIVEIDHGRTGAPETKNRALSQVTTEYVAFLDDDDEFREDHLEVLFTSAKETGADVTYGWYEVIGGTDPRPDRFGVPFDADLLRQSSYIHTAPLVRTVLLQQAGGFQHQEHSRLDDWGAWVAMLDLGAAFVHVPERTYLWRHWLGNTSGLPERWS